MTVAKAIAFAASVVVSTVCCSENDRLDPYPRYRSTIDADAKSDRLPIIKPIWRPGIDVETPRNQALPPKEYDKPYTGLGAFIVRRGHEVDLRENCRTRSGKQMFHNDDNRAALGCAMRGMPTEHDCTIYVANDYVLQRWRMTYEIVYRHERAHCNNAHHDTQGRWLN
jgi:hypothetical protein